MSKIIKEHLLVDSDAIQYMTFYFLTNTLRIKFGSEHEYDYHQVPDEVYFKIKFSSSIGQAFNENVKNKYEFTRVSM